MQSLENLIAIWNWKGQKPTIFFYKSKWGGTACFDLKALLNKEQY